MNPHTPDLFAELPAGDDLRTGAAHLREGRLSIPACLASLASPLLVRAGILKETINLGPIDTEHTLYHLLSQTESDPYSAYRSRLQELASFQNALEHRLRWEAGLTA